MKIINVKLYNSDKIYKLTAKQANALSVVMSDKSRSSELVRLGEDMVKISSIKSLETCYEDNIEFLPTYTQMAIKRENGEQKLIEELPKVSQVKNVYTKRFFMDGTETSKTWRQLEKEHENFYEEDFEVISEKIVPDENGITHRSYELGKKVAKRVFKTTLSDGIYYTCLVS